MLRGRSGDSAQAKAHIIFYKTIIYNIRRNLLIFTILVYGELYLCSSTGYFSQKDIKGEVK